MEDEPEPGMNPFRSIRFYSIELTLLGILGLAIAFFVYLGYGLLQPTVGVEEFSGARALDYAVRQLEFGERSVGTAGNNRTGDWLVEELRNMGWDVIIQPYTIADTVAARNIVAVRDGAGARRPVALLVTHYDSRLFADQDPNPANHIQPTPGANSGASGPAVLLELARTLDLTAVEHTVCLAFVDADDNGGLPGWQGAIGSAYLLQRLETDLARCRDPRFAVYLDRVGGVESRFIPESNSSEELRQAIWRTADELGYGRWFPPNANWTTTAAHLLFLEQEIPAALIAARDYPYLYTMQDTVDKLSPDTLERVGRTLKAWLEAGAPF
ncbi:MAG: hypothetical protein KatS3mg050_2329 [Litorilinea sp.]|nr:MAG: hypothetical protein KatS3mg050_2329 [Litorilinea sp.]